MRILIAVPTFENITPDTFKSIYNLEKGDNECIFEFVRGYDCATARNRIAQMSIDKGVDYVLMVDNDVSLPSDVLLNMLEDAKDVCLGYYAHRNQDNIYRGKTSICKLEDGNGVPYFNYPLESEYSAEEMKSMISDGVTKIRIHGGGMGCALIKVDIFKRLNYPWYDWVNYADDHRGMLSEDLFFCEKCHRAKIPIYSDARAGCGHLLRHIQWPE